MKLFIGQYEKSNVQHEKKRGKKRDERKKATSPS